MGYLTFREIEILKSLKNGPKSGSDIAKEMNLQRESIYPFLSKLKAKGLVGRRDSLNWITLEGRYYYDTQNQNQEIR